MPLSLAAALPKMLSSPLEPRVVVLGAKDEGGCGLAAVTLLIASPEQGTDDDVLCSLMTGVPKNPGMSII